MTSKTFEAKVLKYVNEFDVDFNSLKELLIPCYEALEWRRKKFQTKTTPKAFRKNINYIRDNLLELHNIISDDGNKKLVKRCEELLKHLDRYEDEKLLVHSKMDNYFQIIFFKNIPTEQNIINLARSDIEDELYLQSIQINYAKNNNNTSINKKSLDSEYTFDLIETIFGIKPTNHEPYYHRLIMIKNKKSITIGKYKLNKGIPVSSKGGKEEMKIFKFRLK